MLAGCATFAETRVEETIQAELPRLVGTAQRYDVSVAGAQVSDQSADLENVRGQSHHRLVGASGSGQFATVKVTERAIVVAATGSRPF